MTVRFDIDLTDIMAFQKHFFETNKELRKYKKVITIAFPVIFILFAAVASGNPFESGSYGMYIYCAAISILWVIFMPKLIMRSWMKKARKTMADPRNLIYFGNRELTLTEDEVKLITPESEDIVKWNAIICVDETTGYYFLYISTNDALVIPKRKISEAENEEMKRLFINKVNCNNQYNK